MTHQKKNPPAKREEKSHPPAVRTSADPLQFIADHVPALIAQVDTQFRYRFVNQAYAQRFGLTPEQVTGRRLPEVVGDAAFETLRPHAQACLAGEAIVWEEEIPCADVGMRTMRVFYTPERGEAGRVEGLLAVIQDITQEKQTEQQLQAGEERFRALADNIAQLAWMADRTGWIFWYNRRWLEYTGTTLEEMQGWGWKQVHHPDHRKRVVERWSEHLRAGHAWEDTFPLRSHQGEYRRFLSRAFPIRDEEGRVVRWFGTNTDVEDLLRAQEALEEQRTLNKTITDNAASGLFMMDQNGYPIFMNPAAEAITGYTLEEIQNRPLHYAVHHSHPDGTPFPIEACPIDRSNESLTPIQGHEDLFVRKDGTFFPVVCACTPLAKEGKRIGAVIEFRDITLQKRAEEAIQQHLLEIEALNARLRRAMGETHHRVGNNLQVISALAEIQMPNDADMVPASALERVMLHVRSLAEIHRLLTQEATATGAVDAVLAREALDKLMPLMQSLLERERRIHMEASDIRLTLRQATSLCILVTELINNAVRHGEGDIFLSLTRRDAQGHLEVRDAGRGFAPGFAPQAAGHIGIDLIRQVAQWDLGGAVLFRNAPEGGAQVSVTFPLVQAPEAIVSAPKAMRPQR